MQIAKIVSGDTHLASDLMGKPPIPTAASSPPILTTQSGTEQTTAFPDQESADAAVKAKQDSGKSVDAKTTADTIEKINDYLQTQGHNLKFKVDKDTGRMIVQIVDSATDEVIRQIPHQELLDIAKRLGDVEGLLFHGDA
jgi:flagellar protein FlaG